MEHKNIPNDGLHEPKDIVFANAGEVYVADGSGSGSWSQPPLPGQDTALQGQVPVATGSGSISWDYQPGGWAVYVDTGSNLVVDSTGVAVTVDGAGAGTNETQLPKGSSASLWDTDEFQPISFDDLYAVELVFEITAQAGATSVDITFGDFETTVSSTSGTYRVYAPVCKFEDVGPQNLVMKTDTGTVTITDRKIKIVQLYGA